MGLVSNALGGAPLPVATAQPPQPPQPQAPAAPSYAPQAPAPQQAMYAPPGYAPPQGVQPAGYSGSPAPIAPQPAPSVPAPIAPQPAPSAPAPIAQVDMRAQLEAEERALAAQAAASNTVPPDFAQAVKVIESSGRGFPMLTGRAAQLRAQLFGMMLPPGGALSGGGELAQRIAQGIEDPAFVIQLARDLAPQQQAPAPQAPQPPAFNPAPMQVAGVQPIQPGPGPYAGVVQNNILPPGAPASNPALAVVQAPAPQAEAPKKRRSRKPASEAAPAAPPVAAAPPAASAAHGYPQPGAGQIPTATAGAADDLEIFVDCLPLGDYQSLRSYVDYVCSTLAAKYCVDATGQRGLQDIRIAPKGSPLGFGGWRGVLAATVRECPPQPGTYYLDTRGSDVNEVVAEALASVCEARGALYARGIR